MYIGLTSSEYMHTLTNVQTKHNLGLIDQAYDTDADLDDGMGRSQWQRFESKVRQLNEGSAKNVQYKVLFMGRHGQGYHNVAEAFYGTHDWDVSPLLHPTRQLPGLSR